MIACTAYNQDRCRSVRTLRKLAPLAWLFFLRLPVSAPVSRAYRRAELSGPVAAVAALVEVATVHGSAQAPCKSAAQAVVPDIQVVQVAGIAVVVPDM